MFSECLTSLLREGGTEMFKPNQEALSIVSYFFMDQITHNRPLHNCVREENDGTLLNGKETWIPKQNVNVEVEDNSKGSLQEIPY